jgi:hypothetical protein
MPRQFHLGFLLTDYGYIKRVPACRQCNSSLRGCLDTTVRGRADFLVNYYITNNKDIDDDRMKWLKAVALIDEG